MNCDNCKKEIKTGQAFFARKGKFPVLSNEIELCEECAAKQDKKPNFRAGGIIKINAD